MWIWPIFLAIHQKKIKGKISLLRLSSILFTLKTPFGCLKVSYFLLSVLLFRTHTWHPTYSIMSSFYLGFMTSSWTWDWGQWCIAEVHTHTHWQRERDSHHRSLWSLSGLLGLLSHSLIHYPPTSIPSSDMVTWTFEVKHFTIVCFTLVLQACHALTCYIMTRWFPIRVRPLQGVIDQVQNDCVLEWWVI